MWKINNPNATESAVTIIVFGLNNALADVFSMSKFLVKFVGIKVDMAWVKRK